jgi:hypothetical protein
MVTGHEAPGEICLHYTGWPSNTCERENVEWWNQCEFLRLSEHMLSYVTKLFRDPRASFTK